jgi:hypothetical protein
MPIAQSAGWRMPSLRVKRSNRLLFQPGRFSAGPPGVAAVYGIVDIPLASGSFGEIADAERAANCAHASSSAAVNHSAIAAALAKVMSSVNQADQSMPGVASQRAVGDSGISA